MDQVNTKATFDEDLFDRAKYAIMCKKLIERHPAERGACTIAVDAPWGVGKSTFLWMWINSLNADNDSLLALNDEEEDGRKPILPIYYNAWESDFCDSALAPLLYSICAMVEKTKDDGWLLPKDDELLTEFISSCGGLLTSLLYFNCSGDATFAPSVGAVGQATTKGLLGLLKRYMHKDVEEPEPDSIGASYDKQLKDREKFREALSTLAQQFGGVYIFIDELDRCKPTFAIETLEIIKHYFDIPGLTFIFGVDMEQLGYAIGGRYGNRLDAGGYLSKFFDYHVRLAMPIAKQMIAAETANIPNYNYDLLEPLTQVFRMCGATPREVPGIIRRANTIWRIKYYNFSPSNSFAPYLLIVALLCMKVKNPDMYSNFLDGKFNESSTGWLQQYKELLDDFVFISMQCPKTIRSVSQECAKRTAEDRKQSIFPTVPVIVRFLMILIEDAPSGAMLRDHLESIIELVL